MNDLITPAARPDPDISATVLEAADHAARTWTSPETGPLRPGSEAHKRAMCAMFAETFNPYKPSIIAWPILEPEAKTRLLPLPIWDIAVRTEGKARQRMLAYAETILDEDVRAAIRLNGWEEGRHKEVLSSLVAAYGIQLAPEPDYPVPRDPEWAYLVTGFSECIDSFFAFGLFEVARRSGYFPPALVDTFEPVIQEEARHILLFANWLAAHRRHLSWPRRVMFEARVWAVWAFLAWERIGTARDMNEPDAPAEDANFTVNGTKSLGGEELSLPGLLTVCLEENDRRFAGYDRRLLRPVTMPALARLALRGVRIWRRLTRGRA
jgi:hypothetical protein